MADPNFHRRAATFTIQQIAEITGASLASGADGSVVLQDVAPLDTAGAGHLTFLDNVKYKDQFKKTKAGACFVRPELKDTAPRGLALLLTPSPYKAYALAAQAFYPASHPAGRISERASIDPSAKIGKGCVIEENVVIRANAKIGQNCWIESNSIIGEGVSIGDHCRVGPNCTVTHALISSYVRLYPNVCVGQDGFGFAPDAKGHVKVPQLGRVLIEDHVEIGAGSTLDRGSGPDTVIGQGTWIDNLVQVGHNVKIGKGCMIAAQSGMAGSTVIEDFVAMGGQVGISGHLHIGKGARLAAKSGVTRDVPAGEEWMGYPAMPMRRYLKGVAFLNRLINKEKPS